MRLGYIHWRQGVLDAIFELSGPKGSSYDRDVLVAEAVLDDLLPLPS